MIHRVLIAEDHETVNISVQKTMNDFGVSDINYNYYCDDAFLRVKKAISENNPYDLLITDLSFDTDHRVQSLKSGFDLIRAIREIQPTIKILVFSSENKPAIIKSLYDNYNIDGYIRKARNDAKELKSAFVALLAGKKYFHHEYKSNINSLNIFEFSEWDVFVLKQLAQGKMQKELPMILEQNNIKPSGLSSIEKRINKIKESFDITTTEQLIAFVKENGIV